MQYKNTIEFIYANLSELQNIVAGIGSDEKIHQIDIDLALSKLRSTYDLLLNLKNESIVTQDNTIEFEVNKPAEKEQAKPQLKEDKTKTENQAKNLADNIRREMAVEKKQVEPTPRTSSKADEKTLSGKFTSEKPALYEEFPKKEEAGGIAVQLKNKPITSITSVIGLNEKFELINNLFKGDKEQFEHTMQILNQATDFNQAYTYLEETFDWDMDNVYVQRILELIRRKLIVRKNEQ